LVGDEIDVVTGETVDVGIELAAKFDEKDEDIAGAEDVEVDMSEESDTGSFIATGREEMDGEDPMTAL
jgi:hypothetical protein